MKGMGIRMKVYRKPQCISYDSINSVVPIAVVAAATKGVVALSKTVGAAAMAGAVAGLSGTDITLNQKQGLIECIVE